MNYLKKYRQEAGLVGAAKTNENYNHAGSRNEAYGEDLTPTKETLQYLRLGNRGKSFTQNTLMKTPVRKQTSARKGTNQSSTKDLSNNGKFGLEHRASVGGFQPFNRVDTNIVASIPVSSSRKSLKHSQSKKGGLGSSRNHVPSSLSPIGG